MKAERPRIWLSIDWDYFCRQPPFMWDSGRDESVSQTSLSWAVRTAFCLSRGIDLRRGMNLRYARPLPGRFWGALEALGYDFGDLKAFVVAESHKAAYEAFRGRQTGGVRLVTFDAHHDLFYSSSMIEHVMNGIVDCGNWHLLTLLRYPRLRSLLVYPRWKGLSEWRRTIRNLEAGESGLGIREWLRNRVEVCAWPNPRIREVAGRVERIFICRSSAWSPPWHDKAFSRFVLQGEKHTNKPALGKLSPREFDLNKVQLVALLESRMLGVGKRA
jgi:hypothetical protein